MNKTAEALSPVSALGTMAAPPPIPETYSVRYQVPREVLTRIWWKRMTFRKPVYILAALSFFLFLVCLLFGERFAPSAFTLLFLILLLPFIFRAVIVKTLERNTHFTDPKTLEFSPSRIVAIGPNWRTEAPWNMYYRGFSEDAEYFYLHMTSAGLAAVIPKNVFTAESQQKFREFARAALVAK